MSQESNGGGHKHATIRVESIIEGVKILGLVSLFLLFWWAWRDTSARISIHERQAEIFAKQVETNRLHGERNEKHALTLIEQTKKTQDSLDLSIKVFRSRDKIYGEMVVELREIYKRQEQLIKALEKKYCDRTDAEPKTTRDIDRSK